MHPRALGALLVVAEHFHGVARVALVDGVLLEVRAAVRHAAEALPMPGRRLRGPLVVPGQLHIQAPVLVGNHHGHLPMLLVMRQARRNVSSVVAVVWHLADSLKMECT
jgi:hypothetical protein